MTATDADGDSLTFSLTEYPAGMDIDPITGLLTWTAPGTPGSADVVVEVSDGRGQSDTQSFTLTVEATPPVNQPPRITSSPTMEVRAGRQYAYDVRATDPDNDPVGYILQQYPSGVSFDGTTGRLRWTPSPTQVGTFTFEVVAVDAQGAVSEPQLFTVTVTANRPPRIEGQPPTTAVAGTDYFYSVRAIDPDGDSLTFRIIDGEQHGISIDPDGLVRWSVPAGYGGQAIAVTLGVSDGLVELALSYTIQVSGTPINHAPVILSSPPTRAVAGGVYEYQVVTRDPDDDPLSYELRGSTPSGMTINPTTGLLSWDPTVAGTYSFWVAAVDTGDLAALQQIVLVVRANTAPEVIEPPAPPATVTRNALFRHDVWVTDAENDPVSFTLTGPAGMSIDAQGRVTWSQTYVLPDSYPWSVTVTDIYGASTTENYTIEVVADTQDPVVLLEVQNDPAAINVETRFRVTASDNVGVSEQRLEVSSDGGQNWQWIVLDGQGVARWTPATVGVYQLRASAKDVNQLTTTFTRDLDVIDPSATQPPVVNLTSPAANAKVTTLTDITGMITDNGTLLSWKLEYRPVDGSSDWKLIKQVTTGLGSSVNVNQTFDPTLLANGAYVLRLTATDTGGNTGSDQVTVQVDGNLKLGNFTLSFVDLQIPVVGIPITITRSYDTLNADRQGDFGYGWSLDLSNTKVTIDHGDYQETGLFGSTPFRDGTRVVITLPDGSTEGFTFYGQQSIQGFIQTPDYQPRFLPDPGVKSQLLVEPRWLRKLGDGYIDMETGYDYTPVDPLLSTGYTLRLRNGTELAINAQTGELSSATDLNGNTITFTGMGIEHSAGRSVQFERDPAGRITAVIDPAGNRIRYRYDGEGNLVSVTDRVDATTQFTYRSDRPHYLDQVIDPLGRTAARTEYDEQGRIQRLIDSDGKIIEYTWNGETRVQIITDQLQHTTIIETDVRGNVIRQEDPEGGIKTWSYDADDNLLSETIVVGLEDSSANGENNDLTTTYSYNTNGDRIETIDTLGNVTRTTFNDYGQPLATTDALGNARLTTVDERGLVTSMRNPQGKLARFVYDNQGNLTRLNDDNGNSLLTNTYNSFGEVISSTPAVGRTTYFDYNVNGDQVATWYFDGEGTAQVQVLDVMLHNEVSRAVGTLRAVLPAGAFITQDLASATIPPQYVSWSTSTSYNAVGQVIAQTDQFGLTTENYYDPRGQLIQTRREVTDENGNPAWLATRIVYDAAGRAIAATSPYLEGTNQPIEGTLTSYDGNGQVTTSQQVRGLVIDLTGTGALMEAVLIEEGTVVSSSSTQYDNAGRVTVATDSYGLQTETTYNVAGQIVQTRRQSVNENGQTVWLISRTVYDEFGRVNLVLWAYASYDPSGTLVDEDGFEFPNP